MALRALSVGGVDEYPTQAKRGLEWGTCIVLIVAGLGLFVLWSCIIAYVQPMTINGRWWMFRICLVGFLSMLMALITALRNRTGWKSGILAVASFLIGVADFVGMMLSIPVS